jgi:hypothetical protein
MLHTTSDRRLPSITDAQRGWSGGVDPVVQTFVSSTYANITDPAQIIALNYLVTALKENGLWSRIKLLYPFIGGNATSHRFNLVDPSLYAITFTGSFVHDSNGITGTPNANATATTGYADGNNDPTDFSFAYYGTWNSTASITFSTGTITTTASYLYGGNTVKIAGGSILNTTGNPGFHAASTTSASTSCYFHRNQFVTGTFTRGTTLTSSWIIQLSLSSNGNTNNMKLAYIGQAYTQAEMLIFEEIVEQYQELLGRQVYTINPDFDIYTNRFLNTVGFANVDSGQQYGLDYLITNLRNTTIFSKLTYLFPMVGTNAATQVRDVVQLASLGLSGSFTHTLSGMDPQTTSSFAQTPTGATTWATLGWTQAFIAAYINEQNTTNGYDWFSTTFRMDFQATNGSSLLIRPFGGATSINAANTTTTGFWLVNIPGFSQPSPLYRNGSIIHTPTSGSNNSTAGPYLFATNAGSGSLRRQALAAWGSTALTGTEPTDFNTIVQQYQTLLSRA